MEAASFVAAGLVSGASISGPSIGFEQFGDQIGSTVLYFFSGQICIILFTCLYEKITGFSVKDELTQNNGAAGIAFGLGECPPPALPVFACLCLSLPVFASICTWFFFTLTSDG